MQINYWILITGIAIGQVAEAKSYIPLGSPLSAPTWTQGRYLPVKDEARPFLPGMRPVELELLEDALRRKMPRTIDDSREQAHKKIIHNSLRDPVKRSHIKGIMAEALFLEKNPHWGYVGKPNASQHDIYTRISGRQSPYTAQIKTHASGDARIYAQDMKEDHLSNRFLVPDDHVAPLREHWRNKIQEHETTGRIAEATDARKQLARVRGLGFTAKYLDDSYTRAARYAFREQNAGYVSLGAAGAMAIGPELWDLWNTGSVTNQSMLRIAHMVSVIGTERVISNALARHTASTRPFDGTNTSTFPKLGSLRGSVKGNAIVGLPILVIDTAWSTYEYGGARALQNTDFYTNLGGSVGGLALGMAVGVPAASVLTTLTGNPMIGGAAGAITALAAGTAGNIGGRTVTRKILVAVKPDLIYKPEDQMVSDAKKNIEDSINLKLKGIEL